ncbi:MAG: Peptidoglycan glycosyltransferase MrdB [Firmicutes bacterium]|nr:Peptidoglycan glycosyltransferase MrdB [Bacillota bacterium]
MIDRRLFRSFDWLLYLAYLGVSLFGALVIWSASQNNEFGDPLFFVTRQLQWVLVGQVLLIIVLFFDYQLLVPIKWPIYLLSVALLVLVLAVGVERGGAVRWINIAGFVLQPSEFAKLAIVTTLAITVEHLGRIDSLWKVVLAFLHIGIPMALIAIQPDLGTSLVFLGILAAVLYVAGITRQLIATVAVSGVLSAPLIWFYGLRDYQRTRLLIFWDPSLDRVGAGYNLMQSIIAVGSGMFMGRGFGQGPQSRNNFLPEQHTDFIFSVVGEEFGFLGSVALLAVFFFIIYRCLQTAAVAKDHVGRYLAVGVAAWIAFQVVVNVGMTMGVMPVTGLPLPFMTYGGSSYLALTMGVGLVLNVHLRHRKILF